jgi:hypothetical protein
MGRRGRDPEDGEARSSGPDVGVRGFRRQPVEEHADLPGPRPQIGPQDLRLVVVGELDGDEGLDPATDAQRPFAGGPQVANPAGLAARRHEVADVLDGQQVDDGRAELTGGPTAHLQYP